jgi:hypothetical protein
MKKSLSLLLMLLALGAGGHTHAAEPVPVAAANLGFDKWENGAPAGYDAVLYIDAVTPPEYR